MATCSTHLNFADVHFGPQGIQTIESKTISSVSNYLINFVYLLIGTQIDFWSTNNNMYIKAKVFFNKTDFTFLTWGLLIAQLSIIKFFLFSHQFYLNKMVILICHIFWDSCFICIVLTISRILD